MVHLFRSDLGRAPSLRVPWLRSVQIFFFEFDTIGVLVSHGPGRISLTLLVDRIHLMNWTV